MSGRRRVAGENESEEETLQKQSDAQLSQSQQNISRASQ
jgi:hypothetical protein